MARNVGRVDQLIRLGLGILLLGLYGALDPPLKYFTLVGLIPLGTALTRSCPVYGLFGISTAKTAGTAPR